MRSTRFTSADDQRQFHTSYLLQKKSVVQGILIDIYTPPFTGIVSINWNDPKANPSTAQVLFPNGIGPWFTHDSRFPFSLKACSRFDLEKSIGFFQTLKNFFEFHFSPEKKGQYCDCSTTQKELH